MYIEGVTEFSPRAMKIAITIVSICFLGFGFCIYKVITDPKPEVQCIEVKK